MSLRQTLIAFLLGSIVMVPPALGQILDKPRADQNGCARPAPPPGSDTAVSHQGPVVAARYFGATQDYPHGVLGDRTEATGLLVHYRDASFDFCDVVQAGPDRVFEDTSPRLVDLDGDGLNEVIVVASHMDHGARLEVYGYPAPNTGLGLIAATPYIGTRFRWLAPIGAADLDGDGAMEIAYIDRPHLAKTLRIWRFANGQLTQIASAPGFTNHKIGWAYIAGGIRDCGAGPEMILASGDWREIMAVRLTETQITAQVIAPYEGGASLVAAQSCP